MPQINSCLHCALMRRMKRRDISLLLRQPDDLRAWLQETREYLYWKMQREQSYLDRRRTRGVHTSTDDDLEADQILEANLLDLLDEMAAKLEESI
jgi:hypothetical protein